MRHAIAALLVLGLAVPAAPAAADGWEAFKAPGAIALMRHAHAPGTGDPADFTLGDCGTQRNLDERGREQARQIGEAIRAEGIVVDRVLTSRWCRSSETAVLLGLGTPDPAPAFDSFFSERSQRGSQTEAARELLAATGDERVVVVTHQVNISALTGRFTRSGEIIVVDVAEDGTVEVLGEIETPVP